MASKIAGVAEVMAMRFGKSALGTGHTDAQYLAHGVGQLNQHADDIFHTGQGLFNSGAKDLWSNAQNRGLFANNSVGVSSALNPWQAQRNAPQMRNMRRHERFFDTDKSREPDKPEPEPPIQINHDIWDALGGGHIGPRGVGKNGGAYPDLPDIPDDYVPPSVQRGMVDDLFEGFAEDGRNQPFFRPTSIPKRGPYGPSKPMNPNYDPDA